MKMETEGDRELCLKCALKDEENIVIDGEGRLIDRQIYGYIDDQTDGQTDRQ